MHIGRLERIVRKEMAGRGGSHDLSHARRVLANARSIADSCGEVDMRLLTAMCLLHDIVRIEGEGESESAALSAERSAVLLRDCGFAEDEIRAVMDGIRSHSLVSRGGSVASMLKEPETMEERILFDADKMDALGPVGIARWFATTSARRWDLGKSAREYVRIVEDFMVRKGGFYTRGGNRLAAKRLEYSMQYMKELLRQLDGEPGRRRRK